MTEDIFKERVAEEKEMEVEEEEERVPEKMEMEEEEERVPEEGSWEEEARRRTEPTGGRPLFPTAVPADWLALSTLKGNCTG